MIDHIDLERGIVVFSGVPLPIAYGFDGDGDETDDPDETEAIVFELPGDGIWVECLVCLDEVMEQ